MFKLLAVSEIASKGTRQQKLAPTAHAPFATLAAAISFGKKHFKALPWSVGRAGDKGCTPMIAIIKPNPDAAERHGLNFA